MGGLVQEFRLGRHGVDQQSRSAGVGCCVDMGNRVWKQAASGPGSQRRLGDKQGCADRGIDTALRDRDAAPTLIRQHETAIDRSRDIVWVTLNGGRMPQKPIRRHLYVGKSRRCDKSCNNRRG